MTFAAATFATWDCAATEPNQVDGPAGLDDVDLAWWPIDVPGTIAAALIAAGVLPHGEAAAAYLEDHDWWIRTVVNIERAGTRIRFGGIATATSIFIDNQVVATGRNMFTPIEFAVAEPGRHELAIVCRSLSAISAPPRPRAVGARLSSAVSTSDGTGHHCSAACPGGPRHTLRSAPGPELTCILQPGGR